MDYNIEDLEDNIVAALQLALPTTTIRTYAGELSGLFFEDASRLQGLVAELPFIFVEYNGKLPTQKSANFQTVIHRPVFRFYVGAESLRTTQEAARSCYSILRTLFDTIHGKYFNYSGATGDMAVSANILGAGAVPQISLGGNQQQQAFTEIGGEGERTLFILPRIAVYVSDYNCGVVTG